MLVHADSGHDMVEWACLEGVTEEVDVVRHEFILVKHVRKKYRCEGGAAPVRAKRPACLPGGGRYSLAFAVEVAVSKYGDHGPLERQVRIMLRAGLDVDSSTLCEQVERLARFLNATYIAIREHVVLSELDHAGETHWYMLDHGRKKCWVWSVGCHDAVYFRIDRSRGHEVVVDMLGGFGGVLVVDGYRAYSEAARELGEQLRPRAVLGARPPEVGRSRGELPEGISMVGGVLTAWPW